MGVLGNFMGIFKKSDVLDLAKEFKLEYEVGNMENMKSIVDKFVDHYPDSYFASCSMVIYVILLYNEKQEESKIFPTHVGINLRLWSSRQL